MTRTGLILILVALVLTLGMFTFKLSKGGIDKGLLIDSEKDLGKVDLNTKRQFKIPLTNTTKNRFEISKVYTSCGCTTVAKGSIGSARFYVEPDDKAEVLFEFDPASMHSKGDVIDHEIYFLVTSTVETEYKVKITGKII